MRYFQEMKKREIVEIGGFLITHSVKDYEYLINFALKPTYEKNKKLKVILKVVEDLESIVAEDINFVSLTERQLQVISQCCKWSIKHKVKKHPKAAKTIRECYENFICRTCTNKDWKLPEFKFDWRNSHKDSFRTTDCED